MRLFTLTQFMSEYRYGERGQEQGIKGTDLNFKFKVASLGNVVFIDHRIMDVAFLISLTHKNFSSALLLPIPASSLFLWFVFSRQLIALTFGGNKFLMNVSVVFVLDFQSLIDRLCANFTQPFFPSCCLYCLLERSSAHISF